MAQHDYVIANGTGAAVRSDLNNALAAIVSQNSGATEPATTYAYQWWADTTTNLLKLRNSANSGWITLFQLDGEWSTIALENGTAGAPSIYFKDSGTDTGFYSPGANQVGISTGGTAALVIDSSQRVGLGTGSPDARFSIVSSATNTPGIVLTQASGASDGNYAAIRSKFAIGNEYCASEIRFGVQSSATGTAFMAFATGNNSPSERVRITNDGLVGIGDIAPESILHLKGSNATLKIENSVNTGYSGVEFDRAADDTHFAIYAYDSSHATQANNVQFYGYQNGSLSFHTNSNERARIDSSGRLLIGTSSTRGNFFNTTGIDHLLQIETTGYYAQSWVSNGGTVATGGAYLTLGRTRGTTAGSNTAVASGDTLGVISFQGADGSQLVDGARIDAIVDGTPGADDLPTRLVFSVTRDGQSSPTESLRISNNGAFDAYTGAAGDGMAAHSSNAAGTTVNLFTGYHSATSTQNGTGVFAVRSNGNVYNTNGTYGTLSDVKLKENIVDAKSQWADIKALQVRNFNFKEGQTHRQIGFIAQEVEQVSPGLVSDSPDRDEDGNETGELTKQVNLSVLYIKAVKALQEAMERIEALETKVAALEAS